MQTEDQDNKTQIYGMRLPSAKAQQLQEYADIYGWNTADTFKAFLDCETRLQKAIERWTVTESRQGKEIAYRLLDHEDLCYVGEVDISREDGYAELAVYLMENARLPIPLRYRDEISIKKIL